MIPMVLEVEPTLLRIFSLASAGKRTAMHSVFYRETEGKEGSVSRTRFTNSHSCDRYTTRHLNDRRSRDLTGIG